MPDQPWVPRPVNDLADSLADRVSEWQLDAEVSHELGDHLAHALYAILITDRPTASALERMRRMTKDSIRLHPAAMPEDLGGPMGILEAAHQALQIVESRKGLARSAANPGGIDFETLTQCILDLGQVLTEFGSAYELSIDPLGIGWRVPPEVVEVMAAASRAVKGEYPRAAARLREAWDAAYRLNPNASDAMGA